MQSCQRHSEFAVYLNGIHTGSMARTESWQGKQAKINTTSKASILGIKTQYQQQAKVQWSDAEQGWLTQEFTQNVSGFRTRNMQVAFAADGLSSEVDLDGKINRYQSKYIPLRDVDTLAIQIRHLVMQGKTKFTLIRQASDGTELYQYQRQPPAPHTIAPWGEQALIPVVQTGAEDITYYFAPELDYQLFRADYHGLLLQGKVLLTQYQSNCASEA
ncbi:hypothetical protein [Motilimonas eburnea]|uniref:hypothetical protein n=1 Tax=Motilimonas eburnea TaxID=1737488 RepID=UPI001E4B77EE|nr:hypothetical protein [Motilimonas eburnea]MCE2571150.1 hypothetical protein [Motilimonas eburnea]